MNYNEYNLRQLLELALRVPEIGAVNFSILYYILKTIIERGGLEEVKPVCSLDMSVVGRDTTAETQTGSSIKRSHSVESLVSTKGATESIKWDKIKVFKRLDAVEDEIDSIHLILSELVNKVSNLEEVSRSKDAKVEEVVFKESVLMEMKEEINELRKKYEKIATDVENVSEKTSQLHKFEETLLQKTLLEPKLSQVALPETIIIELDEEKSEEGKSEEIKLNEPELKEEQKLVIYPKTTQSEIAQEKSQEKPGHKPEDKPEEKPEEVTESEIRKTNLRAIKEQEILSKIEALNKEIIAIKERLKAQTSSHAPAEKKASETLKEERVIGLEEVQSKQEKNIAKIDLQILNVSKELQKLMDKYSVLDRTLSFDINKIKESTLILEHSSTKYDEEIEGIKANVDEMIHSLEGIKENLTYMETQVAVLTEFSGIKNRIEQLEEYVYSGSEYHRAEKKTEPSKTTDVKEFKPTTEETKKLEPHEIEEYLDEYDLSGETEEDCKAKHFHIVSQSVALVQDMQKKKEFPGIGMDLYRTSYIEDLYDESKYDSKEEPQKFQTDDFGKIEKKPSLAKVSKENFDEKIKSSTFTSPDLLEEHSHQLRGQVVVYVKKRLHDFDIELQVIEGNIASLKKKSDYLEKYSKELGEKITYMDANFSQRAGDLVALKSTAENHQASIISIMHHLERKAEAYAVNQKVSRRELTVIEDRVLKLCKTASSEITRLEEKIDDSFEKFISELDKKIFTEEFELRLDFIRYKLKVFESKLEFCSTEQRIIDFQGIRSPIEIKKYVVSKDGTRIKQDKSSTWKTKPSNDTTISLLEPHHVFTENSDKTSTQVPKTLELASTRESKRYVEGAYTKINVGKK